jgi:hypothetical protein
MGGEQKKIELCQQATFLSENKLLRKNCSVFNKRVPSCANKYFWKPSDMLRSKRLALQEGKLNS